MYKQFKTDEALEKQGIWIDYGTFKVLCARSGGQNMKWQKVIDILTKPYKRQIEAGTLPPQKGEELLRVAFARAVVLGWSVAVDAKGNPINDDADLPVDDADRTFKDGMHAPDGSLLPYNEQNVIDAFKALPDLFADIRQQTGNATLYKEDIREAEQGNSKRS